MFSVPNTDCESYELEQFNVVNSRHNSSDRLSGILFGFVLPLKALKYLICSIFLSYFSFLQKNLVQIHIRGYKNYIKYTFTGVVIKSCINLFTMFVVSSSQYLLPAFASSCVP